MITPASVAAAPMLQMPINAPPANEYSNLSSAGSVSDREPETPEKLLKPLKSASEKKPPRKRKRAEDQQKSDRKITECFRVCYSTWVYIPFAVKLESFLEIFLPSFL